VVGRNLLLLTLVSVLALTGCGGTNDGEQADGATCVVLVSGSKLCGRDAKTYCERFAQNVTDGETIRACVAVGADLTSPEEEQRDAQRREAERAATDASRRIADGRPLRAAVRRIMGAAWVEDHLIAIEREGSDVTIATDYNRGVTNRPPPPPTLDRLCRGMHTAVPAVSVQVEDLAYEEYSCP